MARLLFTVAAVMAMLHGALLHVLRDDAVPHSGNVDVEKCIDIITGRFVESEKANAIRSIRDVGRAASSASPALVKILSDESSSVTLRRLSAETLGTFGDDARGAVPAMVTVLLDEGADRTLRAEVAIALGKIRPPDRDVVCVLSSAATRPTSGTLLQVEAAYSLGLIRSAPDISVPALVPLLRQEQEPQLQAAAASALAAFGFDARCALHELVLMLERSSDSSPSALSAAAAIIAIANDIQRRCGELPFQDLFTAPVALDDAKRAMQRHTALTDDAVALDEAMTRLSRERANRPLLRVWGSPLSKLVILYLMWALLWLSLARAAAGVVAQSLESIDSIQIKSLSFFGEFDPPLRLGVPLSFLLFVGFLRFSSRVRRAREKKAGCERKQTVATHPQEDASCSSGP